MGALGYAYDSNGNRASLTATIGTQVLTTTSTHDDANRLDIVTDPAGRPYDHGYDANGNRSSLAYPNGTSTTYAYNSLNRLTNLTTTHPASGVTIQSYGFTLGPAGNRTKIVEHDGTVRDYGYDDLYRLTSETVTISGLTEYGKTFLYHNVGNRQTQATVGGRHRLAGDAHGSRHHRLRLRHPRPHHHGSSQAYGWDTNGNLTSKDAEATYVWDFENRLARVTKLDGTVVEHVYDADGNRVQTKTTPPGGPTATTNFLVDTSGSLSHAVAETDETGALKVYYVGGNDLLAVMRPLVPAPTTPADWQTRFVHADGLGSIRRLTDENGLITDGYSYSAFGELLAHTGTDPQPYAFAGEPYDPNVGFQYHRARWYAPRTGRFTSTDRFAGLREEPTSLHRYNYAHAQPTDFVDPSGQFEGLAVQLTVVAMVTTIFSISCASLRPQKSVGVQWMDGLLVGLPPDVIATMKDTASSVMQRGIGQFGIPVTGGNGYYRVDVRDRATHVPRGLPPGAVLGLAVEARRAEAYYESIRSVVRAVLPASSQNGQAFGEAMGNAVGFVAVHEWGHLATNREDGYHDEFDPTAYNTESVDSASPIMANTLIGGLGHWPKNTADWIRRNLAQ